MIQEVLRGYLELFPEDKHRLEVLIKQVDAGEDLSDRRNFTGHITGGAIVFSPSLDKVLLINHPTLKKWLQPGGHWEPNEAGPWMTAERELQEETSARIECRLNVDDDQRIPVLIDSHFIPANPAKNEREHLHHDFKYVFLASDEKLILEDGVITEAEWVELNDSKKIQGELRRTIKRAEQLFNS